MKNAFQTIFLSAVGILGSQVSYSNPVYIHCEHPEGAERYTATFKAEGSSATVFLANMEIQEENERSLNLGAPK